MIVLIPYVFSILSFLFARSFWFYAIALIGIFLCLLVYLIASFYLCIFQFQVPELTDLSISQIRVHRERERKINRRWEREIAKSNLPFNDNKNYSLIAFKSMVIPIR